MNTRTAQRIRQEYIYSVLSTLVDICKDNKGRAWCVNWCHNHTARQYSHFLLLAPIPEYEMGVVKFPEEDDDITDLFLPEYL